MTRQPITQGPGTRRASLDPQAIYGELLAAIEEHVMALEESMKAEAQRDATKALIFTSLDEGPVEYRKAMVLLDDRYKRYDIAYIDAVAKAKRAELEYKALVIKIELMRTIESSAREELRHASYGN